MKITLVPWSAEDLPLLEKLLGDASMMEHLGGPETIEQIGKRHERYLHLPENDHMFKILAGDGSEAAGSIGYWEKFWRDDLVYETGWSILPAYQGQGIATLAGEKLIEIVRQDYRHRYLHAFPSVDNPASNAICRKLGFTLLEACDFEYPPGRMMRCNDWRLDLSRAQ